jgi:hypothetical protein
MQKLGSRTALKRLTWIVSVAALLMFAALPGAALANKHHKKPSIVGAMYTETNNGSANQLLAFNRYSNGKLKFRQAVDAGGKGGLQPEPGCDPPGGCPLIDADAEVQTTKNGKWVFAVNAGSNTIASFAAGKHSLRLVGVAPSLGVFPNSLTIHGDELYVLDNNSENIAGFRISLGGRLTPIPGAVQPLTPEHAPFSRRISFDNTGNLLVVSLLTDGAFDTFPVTDGVAGPATARPSASPEPFGFSFDPVGNHLVSSEVVNDMDLNQSSNGSSYGVGTDGSLTKISSVPTQGYAACWVEITNNGKTVFMVNTGGPASTGATVTTFGLSPSGQLTYKSVTPKSGTFTLTDEALSRDSKYLYVVAPLVNNPFTMPPPATNGSKILTYKVGKNGLTRIGETKGPLAPGLSGLDGV